MATYLLGLLKVHNPSWMPEYRSRLPAVLARHGGRILVSSPNPLALEGQPLAADRVLLFEFPTPEAAQAWYQDPDHQPLIALRQTGAHLDLLQLREAT